MSDGKLTFHVAFSLVHDERVRLALALAVRDEPYPLNVAVDFKLAPEVVFSDLLGLPVS